jgi:hypothetical protein
VGALIGSVNSRNSIENRKAAARRPVEELAGDRGDRIFPGGSWENQGCDWFSGV